MAKNNIKKIIKQDLNDNIEKTCIDCHEGIYQETSITDDWDGVLHCTHCNKQIKRWKDIF